MNSLTQTDNKTKSDAGTIRKGGRPKKQALSPFAGFAQDSISNEYFRVPAIFLNLFAMIDNLAELKVVTYVMRHTWGFREFDQPKRITIDEFVNGRKHRDGSRMDSGTGLSKSAVLDGIQRAIAHGFIVCFVDDSDKARVKSYYALKMQSEEQKETEQPEIAATFDSSATNSDAVAPDDQLVDDCQEQEEYSQDYDPYANTIFSPNYQPQEQKIFVSEAEPTTTTDVAKNYHSGCQQPPRSEIELREPTCRTKEIRTACTPKSLEESIRYLPTPGQFPKPKEKAPAFVRNMLTDFSRDLGDCDHIGSNISQAAKIYRNSGMTEQEFIETLYEARATAKKATQVKHINSHGNPNRMPYFFKCLSGILRQTAI
jgi:hypothetical protein